MKQLKYICIYSVVMTIMSITLSCEKEADWKLQKGTAQLVIDALITNEYKTQSVKAYNSVVDLNAPPQPVSGISIKIIGDSMEISFIEDSSNAGLYLSEQVFSAAGGISYQLIIGYGKFIDSATSELVAITPMDNIIITPHKEYYRLNYVESPAPSMMEISYDWSGDTAYCKKYGSCYASETFYTLNNLDVNKSFAPAKQIISFPESVTIIRKKYSLSDEHQKFLRSLLLETEWRGGVFDTEPGNVPTNFKQGTRGWFATSMVLTDTTRLNQ